MTRNAAKSSHTGGSGLGRAAPAPSLAGRDWFEQPAVQDIFAALNRNGGEARIVGGSIRSTLMRLPVKDVDFATTHEPETVMRLAREAGLKAVPTGIEHGTVTIVSHGRPFEVTTLRRDVKTDGRHAEVCFTTDWSEDASRRDFTINALYASADGTVHDPLGGMADIRARRVRFIGDASRRIAEDYLRIMRFFRFHAEYGRGAIDEAGLLACIRGRAGLARLSAERIRVELLRTLAANGAIDVVTLMAETGVLIQITGGVPRLADFGRIIAIEAARRLPADPIRRLAALCLFVREDAERLSRRLRLSNAESARLKALAELPRLDPTHAMGCKHLMHRLGAAAYQDAVMLAWVRSRAAPEDRAFARAYALPQRWSAPEFPLSGADLIALGVRKGPAVGRLLRRLEDEWLKSGFAKSRKSLLVLARRLAAAEGAMDTITVRQAAGAR